MCCWRSSLTTRGCSLQEEIGELVLASIDDDWEAERLAAILRAEGRMAVTRPDDGARLDAWMRHTAPISFGDRLSVCFAWSEHDRGDTWGLVELGLGGFGNGAHPDDAAARRGALRADARRRACPRRRMRKRRARALRAATRRRTRHRRRHKPDAVEATRRNAALNGMDDRLEARLTPLAEIDDAFDIVVANIGRAGIVELAPDLVRLVVARRVARGERDLAAAMRPRQGLLAPAGRARSSDYR